MPYDSNQTARLIAMQQQQYSQQAQMAEQIGSMGMPYNTGGYDPRSTANRIGGVATSATLGALPAIGGGLGMMGMLGGLGVRALKPFIPFDPFSAGFAAHSAVGGGSAGVMAGLGVGGAIAGVGMAAGGALQQMYQGAQGYNQIGSTMQNTYGGVFRPQQMEMGGQGFGASERGQMAGLVRKMAHIPELMTNVNELNSIFQKMDQTGMMSGAVNVDDLGRRFKEGIKALRGIGKMLGTTMEEAMPLFNEARQSGFFSATDIMANATQRRFVGGVLGMGQQQVGQIQQSGADLMTAMGGSQRGIGAAGALNQASMLQMAVRTGVLGEERLGAATGGLTGTRGVQSLLGTFQRAGARMSQGSLGQLITAAASETEGGNLTGKIDQDILEQVQAGELSLGELKQMASRNISGKKKAQFAMNREDLTAQVAAQGPGAMVGMLRTAVEDKGIGQGQSFDDVASHILKTHTDMTKAQRDVLIDITKKSRDMRRKTHELFQQNLEGKLIQEQHRTRSISYRVDQTFRKLGQSVAEPLQEMGASVARGFDEWGEDIQRYISGVETTYVTRGQANKFAQSFAMGGSELRGMQAETNVLRKALTGSSASAMGGSGAGGAAIAGGLRGGVAGGAAALAGSFGLDKWFGNQESNDFLQLTRNMKGATRRRKISELGPSDTIVKDLGNGWAMVRGEDEKVALMAQMEGLETRGYKGAITNMGIDVGDNNYGDALRSLKGAGEKLRNIIGRDPSRYKGKSPAEVERLVEQDLSDDLNTMQTVTGGKRVTGKDLIVALESESGGIPGLPNIGSQMRGALTGGGEVGDLAQISKIRKSGEAVVAGLVGTNEEGIAGVKAFLQKGGEEASGLIAKLAGSTDNPDMELDGNIQRAAEKGWDKLNQVERQQLSSEGITDQDSLSSASMVLKNIMGRRTTPGEQGGLKKAARYAQGLKNYQRLEGIGTIQAKFKGRGRELRMSMENMSPEMRAAFSNVGGGMSGEISEMAAAMESGDLSSAQSETGDVINKMLAGLGGADKGNYRKLLKQLKGSSMMGGQIGEGVSVAQSVIRQSRRKGSVSIEELSEMAGDAVSSEDLEKFISKEGIKVSGAGEGNRKIKASDVEKIADEIAGKVTGLAAAGSGIHAAGQARTNYEEKMRKTLETMTTSMNAMTTFVDTVGEHVGKKNLNSALGRVNAQKAKEQQGSNTEVDPP